MILLEINFFLIYNKNVEMWEGGNYFFMRFNVIFFLFRVGGKR